MTERPPYPCEIVAQEVDEKIAALRSVRLALRRELIELRGENPYRVKQLAEDLRAKVDELRAMHQRAYDVYAIGACEKIDHEADQSAGYLEHADRCVNAHKKYWI